MALPRSKYSDPLHTPGNEFTLDGKNYVGWYVITYRDEYYTGKSLTRDSKEIVPIELETPSAGNIKVFVEQQTEPSIDDRVTGKWRRYFVQNKNNLHIIEVKKDRYDAYKRTSGFTIGFIDWVLTGPSGNVVKGPYTYFGAEHQNKLSTQALEGTIIGITEYIKDYSKFVK